MDEEIRKKLKEMNLDHSKEGVQMIKDEIGMLKLRKLMKEKRESLGLTTEERRIFDGI